MNEGLSKNISVPCHIALIMDGNGRWAKQRGLPVIAGHNAGMKAMHRVLKFAGEIGVEHLTVYAFSTENWKRSVEEVGGIFKLLVKYVNKELKNLMKNQIKINILSDIEPLPDDAKKSCKKVLETTKDNRGINFNIALNYGGREEIRKSCVCLAKKVAEREISPEDISRELINKYLYTGKENIPDPDLIIRTSGEIRLSNFLLWQGAYSELIFENCLWPDFGEAELSKAIEIFNGRHRRFGGR